MKIGFKNLHQLISYMWLMLANVPMSRGIRWKFVKLAGVRFLPPDTQTERRKYFIGKNVTWDSVYPEDIEIGNFVNITNGCVILSHFFSIDHKGWVRFARGKVRIEDHVYLGTNVIITKPVTIGHHSVVGAGSVVTKDIPPCEIWAGVPARCIRRFEITEGEQ